MVGGNLKENKVFGVVGWGKKNEAALDTDETTFFLFFFNYLASYGYCLLMFCFSPSHSLFRYPPTYELVSTQGLFTWAIKGL
jgi:hypothetical protein